MKYFSFALVVLVACGGATTSPLLDGGDDGSADGSQGSDAQPNKDSGPDCAQLLIDLETKREAAAQCCITCGTLQCTQQIDGLCCPLTVTSGDSLASKDYLKALQAVKDASCQVNCPAPACSTKPSDVCQPNGSCAQ